MQPKKIEGIQILRGYAAILVVVTHLWSMGFISSKLRFSQAGGFGVDVFFIISGFIMCFSLRDRISTSDSFQFLKKRIYRVHPIYLIILIPFLIEYLYQNSVAERPLDAMLVIGNLLLLPSFFGGKDYKMLVSPAWTLSYELFFYVLFAAGMLSSKFKIRAICTVMIAIVLMVTMVNIFGIKGPRLQWSNFQYMVGDTLFFNFVLGCICYFVWKKFGRPLFSFWIAIGSALVLTAIALLLARGSYPRIISFGLPAFATVLIFLFAELEIKNLTKLLVFLGSASYSIYLVHAIIAHWKHLVMGASVPENDLSGIALTLTAVAAGCIFYVNVESPISRLLHRSKGGNL